MQKIGETAENIWKKWDISKKGKECDCFSGDFSAFAFRDR